MPLQIMSESGDSSQLPELWLQTWLTIYDAVQQSSIAADQTTVERVVALIEWDEGISEKLHRVEDSGRK